MIAQRAFEPFQLSRQAFDGRRRLRQIAAAADVFQVPVRLQRAPGAQVGHSVLKPMGRGGKFGFSALAGRNAHLFHQRVGFGEQVSGHILEERVLSKTPADRLIEIEDRVWHLGATETFFLKRRRIIKYHPPRNMHYP